MVGGRVWTYALEEVGDDPTEGMKQVMWNSGWRWRRRLENSRIGTRWVKPGLGTTATWGFSIELGTKEGVMWWQWLFYTCKLIASQDETTLVVVVGKCKCLDKNYYVLRRIIIDEYFFILNMKKSTYFKNNIKRISFHYFYYFFKI